MKIEVSKKGMLERWRAGAVVSRFQARRALKLSQDEEGVRLFDKVQPAIDAIEDAQMRELVQDAWEEASEFRRTSPVIKNLGGILGLEDTELDDLFELAKTIEA